MPIRVLVKDHPHRTIALSTEGHALVFRHTHAADLLSNGSTLSLGHVPAGRQNTPPKCMVEFGGRSTFDLGAYRTVVIAQGTLGLITLNNDVFICVVTGDIQAASPRPGETVRKIVSVEFYCLNRSDYDHVHSQDVNAYIVQGLSSDDVESTDPGEAMEHPFHPIKKLLNGGNFYYSADFDLTGRLQERSSLAKPSMNPTDSVRANTDTAVDIASLDQGLLWNSYMIRPLLEFRSRLSKSEKADLDKSQMLTSVIRGFASTLIVPPSSAPLRKVLSSQASTLTLISRLSSRRAGTRFNSRGLDDDGNVANFVETETIYWSPTGVCFSYVQIRGSIPVFWESSSSLIPGQQKIQITRSPEATQPAFDKHFESLENLYGAVHIVNLLSISKPGEAELTGRYELHIARSPLRRAKDESHIAEHKLLRVTEFDFHERTKGASGYDGARAIRPLLEDSAETLAYFLSEGIRENITTDGKNKNDLQHLVTVLQQNGIFRVNCLDCLDRTNLVQTIISQMALDLFLSHRSESAAADFWMRHSTLWADNGDALSKIYAGTGALKSSFTRHGKMSLAGAIADARKSATRLYVNNFADKARQNTIDLLLGRLIGQAPVQLYDPINDFVTVELNRRAPEYTSSRMIYIRAATFNLNGKTEGAHEDLSSWLCPAQESQDPEPDIVAVGFQEIVELNAQQIMNTDPAYRALWEHAVKRTLNSYSSNRSSDPDDGYVLLRSDQLVGAALMIFVKASFLPTVRNVEGSIKKTGLSGIAGNKGAVAIRMDVAATSLCFVTAHLAAGFANYEERNTDYRTIVGGLRFQKSRSIDDHDSIIWLGDFNYRIGLGDKETRALVAARDLEKLYMNDQLNLQMVAGMAFQYYYEARIAFLPTYKFDLGTDNYDTSEKGRIPAWCDRILRKGNNLRQTEYNTAPLRFSDHRPVFGIFECQIQIIDEPIRSKLTQQLYETRRKDLHTRRGAIDGIEGLRSDDDSDDDDLMGYESIAPGLPPASSDRRKWWLDGDKPARSKVGPPREGMELNDRRPANPWRPTNEPDWVDVRRPSSIAGSANGGSQSRKGSPKPQLPPPRRKMIVPAWDGDRMAGTGLSRVDTAELTATTSTSPATTVDAAPRKTAPPKPQKPANLVSSPSQAAIAAKLEPRVRAESTPPPLPSRSNPSNSVASVDENNFSNATSAVVRAKKVTPPPVLPRKVRAVVRTGSVVSSRSPQSHDNGPPLPPRRASTNQVLMDEDSSGQLEGWKALQPR